MSDSDKPRPERPPMTGKGPLPRVWKAGPDPEDELRERLRKQEEERERRKTRRAAKPEPEPEPRKPVPKRAGKGVLLEATPEFDTYDARRRVRMIVGALAGLVCLGAIGYVALLFMPPSESDEELFDEGALAKSEAAAASTAIAAPSKAADREEQAARQLLDGATRLDREGKRKEALVVLDKIAADYPDSASAREAKSARARANAPGSLFGVEPPTVAAAEPKPSTDATEAIRAEVPQAPDVSKTDAVAGLPRNPVASRIEAPSALAKSGAPAKPLPSGFSANPSAGVHASGWPILITSDRDGAEMALVPAGTYLLGRDGGEPAEGPAHRASLSAYYIDRHEVTVRQFKTYLRETGKKFPQSKVLSKGEEPVNSRDDHPYVYVTAREALDYCVWAGKRLPTEAQWEAAGRTSDGRAHPWGDYPASWERERVPRSLDPVMSFPSDMSPLGVFDLAGNAEEWTKDYYDSRYYQQFRDVVADNPAGPTSSRDRPPRVTVKGGSNTWQVSWRDGRRVETRLPYLGFRGVLNPESGPSPSSTNPNAPASKPQGIVPF